jgi:menaquinone-dependent protoporphyrinogen oxidase
VTRILVGFHTTEGQTARVAERIGDVLRDAGCDVEVRDVADAPSPDDFDGVVVGDSIHMGRHSRPLAHYLTRYAEPLRTMPMALFQVSMAAAYSDDEHAGEAQRNVHQLLEDADCDPDIVGVFAGALVYTKYGWIKRRVMRSIEKRQGGDTDISRDYEYTDWAAVEGFARDVHAMVAARTAGNERQLDT